MHMQGSPEMMQNNPSYSSVCDDVFTYLSQRASLCLSLGMTKDQIFLDPGIGFGKSLEHNLTLINSIDRLTGYGYQVLMGASRKAMVGQVLNQAVDDRLYGTMGANAAAYAKGARIFRVHDVLEIKQGILVYKRLLNQ